MGVAGAVASVLALLAGRTLVRVRRLRRTAAQHAHDLEHTGTVGTGIGEPVRLLVLGDSAARGYGLAEPAGAFPRQVGARLCIATGRRVAVTCLATDGHRTADVVAAQLPLVRAARPDAIVVSVGVNDALRGTGGGALAVATGRLLDEVRASADGAVVVVVPCPDLAAAPGLRGLLGPVVGWRCRRVARRQRAVAASHPDVGVVTLPRPDAAMFGVDGLHPGVAGHAAMAAQVADALVRHADTVLPVADVLTVEPDVLTVEPGAPGALEARAPSLQDPPLQDPPMEPAWTSD